MAKAILIKSGGGGVTSSDVTLTAEYMLEGKTSLTSDSNDEVVVGTMREIGEVTKELNAGKSYTIPKGYHNGNGKVSAVDLKSQTSATAVAAQILKDQTAYVNGSKVTGTMPDNGAVAPSALAAGGSYTIPAGYHNGKGKITVQTLATITSSGTVTSNAQILSGYKAYSDGTLYTGSIASLAGGTYSASQTQKTIDCKGKYMTSNIIISATNVQSILSFSFASRNYATANFKWQNPAKGPFYGIVVRGKQGGYPTSATDGTKIFEGFGTNKNAKGTSYSGYKNVGTGTWDFNAYSYYILDGKNVYDSGKKATAIFNCYQCSESEYCDDCSQCRQCHECECNCHDGCADAAGGCPDACCECCNWINTENGCYDCSDYVCSKSYPERCNGHS